MDHWHLGALSLIICSGLTACAFDRSGVLSDESPIDLDDPGLPVLDVDSGAFCDKSALDLVGCYLFDGTLDDASAAVNHPTSESVDFADGVSGQALITTAASNLRLAETESLDLSALTIEMWINAKTIDPRGRAGLFDNDGQYGFFLHPDGTLRCTGGGSVDLSQAITAGEWTHVACTNTGQTITIYVNGEARATTNEANGLGASGGSGSAIAGNCPSGDPFVGAIDELRVWRVARTEAEIRAAAVR